MDDKRMGELAKSAIADSKRNDCEFVGVRVGSEGRWYVKLMDVMLKREPFEVSILTVEDTSDAEIKDAIRRAIATHYSLDSY